VISWFEAIVLGIVQGLTEFLPISSSAHVLIVSQLFGWEDPGAAFTAVTQIGTETAVIIYFRKDIWRIISTWTQSLAKAELRSSIDARMGWYVIIGTIPIGILGFTFQDQIETVARNLWLVAGTLIVFGIILGIADRYGSQRKSLADLNMRDGVLYGMAQSLALIPGVSRSGATISGGLFLGYDRSAATRYALLGAHHPGDGDRVLRRLRRDRLAHPVHHHELLPAVRAVPDRTGFAGAGAAVGGGADQQLRRPGAHSQCARLNNRYRAKQIAPMSPSANGYPHHSSSSGM
jgi:undecaprenyl-diphosphatase